MSDLILVDVGASGGIHRRWKIFLPELKAILFEPDISSYEALVSQNAPYIQAVNIGLFEEPGQYLFHSCSKGQLSSIYRPNTEFINKYPQSERYEIVESQSVSMTSLDEFFIQSDTVRPHFIKLDTQGSELPILRGGQQVLETTVGAELEVEYAPLYDEAPLFPEVDQFMRSKGFQLYDACHYFWNQNIPGVAADSSLGEMIFGEVLYFRPPDNVLDLARRKQIEVDQAIQCYLAYGYTHLAEVLASQAAANGLLSFQEHKSMRDLIGKFRGRAAFSIIPGASTIKWRILHLANRLFPWRGWVWKSKADLGSRYSPY